MSDLNQTHAYVSIGGGMKISKLVMDKLCDGNDPTACKQAVETCFTELNALRWFFTLNIQHSGVDVEQYLNALDGLATANALGVSFSTLYKTLTDNQPNPTEG